MDAATLVLIVNVGGGQKRVDLPKRDMARCEAVAREVMQMRPDVRAYCEQPIEYVPADGRKRG